MADNPFTVQVPNVNGALAALMQGYGFAQKNAQDAALREAGQLYAAGDVAGAKAAAARSGSLQVLMGIENLQHNERDFGFRQTESQRAQQNADRGFGLQEKQLGQSAAQNARDYALRQQQFAETQRMNNAQLEGSKTPAGFERNPEGGLRPVAGGPQDPAYIADTRKPQNLSVSDITKLSEEGGKFANINTFQSTFKDSYAGKPFGMGEASNYLARNLPSFMTGQNERDAATWWQSYDRYKNVVRNDLFGSALTVNEQAAFEKADIQAGMNPSQIRGNLKIQKNIVEGGIKRKAGAMVAQGYDASAIAQAYGISPESLGVKVKPNKAQQPSQAPRLRFNPQTGDFE